MEKYLHFTATSVLDLFNFWCVVHLKLFGVYGLLCALISLSLSMVSLGVGVSIEYVDLM